MPPYFADRVAGVVQFYTQQRLQAFFFAESRCCSTLALHDSDGNYWWQNDVAVILCGYATNRLVVSGLPSFILSAIVNRAFSVAVAKIWKHCMTISFQHHPVTRSGINWKLFCSDDLSVISTLVGFAAVLITLANIEIYWLIDRLIECGWGFDNVCCICVISVQYSTAVHGSHSRWSGCPHSTECHHFLDDQRHCSRLQTQKDLLKMCVDDLKTGVGC